jgi:aminoglycoside 6'-N-acetyltransferase
MGARYDRKGQKIAGAATGARGHNAGVTVNAPTVRPLTRDDLPRLSQWLAEPHVAKWWRDPSDLASVEASYLPCIDGTDPTEVFVIEAEGRAAGLIERYLVADNPEWDHAMQATGAVTGCAAGIDYLIGEPSLTGRGHGTAVISLFTALTFRRYPRAEAIVAAVQQANVGSWRALERAGYHRWWGGQLESSDPSDAGPAYLYGMRRPPAPGAG